MIEINETKEILGNLISEPIIQTRQQFLENYEWAVKLKRESNYKAGMSVINSAECFVYQN